MIDHKETITNVDPRNFTKAQFKKLVGGRMFSVTFTKVDGTKRTYGPAKLGLPKGYERQGGTNNNKADQVTVMLPNEPEKFGARKGEPAIRTLTLPKILNFSCGKDKFVVRS